MLYSSYSHLVEPPRVFEKLSPEHLPLDSVDERGELIKAQVMLVIPPEKVNLLRVYLSRISGAREGVIKRTKVKMAQI